MPTEYWMLGLLVAVAAIVIGFVVGRISAPGEKQSRKLSEELEDKRAELKGMRTNLNHHFEESARLFGTLAYDYRALYAHLSDSAHRLGLTEGETRELLEPADRQFLARDTQRPEIDDSDVDEGKAHPEPETTAPTTPAGDRPTDAGVDRSNTERDSAKQDAAATAAPSTDGDHEPSVDLTKTDAEHPAASPEPPTTARDTKTEGDAASKSADKNAKDRKQATG